MVIADSHINGFVKVTALSSAVRSYIFKNIAVSDKQVLGSAYHLAVNTLPEVLQYAKSTKLHSNIVFDDVTSPKVRELIKSVLIPQRRMMSLSLPSPYNTLHLTPDAPGYIVDAVYKAMVAKNHPDTGGSHEVFVALQQAYDQIKKARNP